MARRQIDAEAAAIKVPEVEPPISPPVEPDNKGLTDDDLPDILTRQRQGATTGQSSSTHQTRRDASVIANEVIAHLSGVIGANVRLTLEIEVDIPDGTPEQVVRIVTETAGH